MFSASRGVYNRHSSTRGGGEDTLSVVLGPRSKSRMLGSAESRVRVADFLQAGFAVRSGSVCSRVGVGFEIVAGLKLLTKMQQGLLVVPGRSQPVAEAGRGGRGVTRAAPGCTNVYHHHPCKLPACCTLLTFW